MTGDVGRIRHKARASQIIDYTGVRFGNATPSDLDGAIELKNKLFIFFEYKHKNAAPISTGQRIFLERLTDALDSAGKTAVTIIGQHSAPVEDEINAAKSKALEVRWKGEWLDLREKDFTVKCCADRAYDKAFSSPF